MKTKIEFLEARFQISTEEARAVTGGGEILDWLKCVRGTLTNGVGGSGRTLVLGGTLWGLARLMGVMVQCANL